MHLAWAGSVHERNETGCVGCHTVHAAADPSTVRAEQSNVCFTCHLQQQADVRKPSAHPLDPNHPVRPAAMVCTDCHNPHAAVSRGQLTRNTTNELCTECHAEYRVAGTMEYSAPELLHPGEPIGELSDMYAVGVSLFQMLTGQLPFQAVDIPTWVQAHLQQSPPPLRTLMPYLPTEVAALLERMLAKQPLRRPTAKELVIELCAIEVDTFCERA